MDGGGDGFLAAVTGWLTPIVLFCLFNLTVATIFILSSLNSKKNNQETQTRLISEENDPVHLFRFPSLLDRVKSFNLSRSYQDAEPEQEPSREEEEEPVKEDEPVEEEKEDEICVETVVKTEEVRGGVKMMKKSESAKIERVVEAEVVERQRPATVRERRRKVAFGEDEAVDAKADDFINRFKQQLRLQRLDSLLRFRGAAN